jgi:hypothetical protein
VAHLRNGYTYSGLVEVSDGVVTIDGRLRVSSGPSDSPLRTYRGRVRRTYPLRALRRIDWTEPAE